MVNMEKVILIKSKAGLSRSGSVIQAKEGSLKSASNVVVRESGCYSPRRGFSKLSGSLPVGVYVVKVIPAFNELIVFCSDGKLYSYDSSTDTYTEKTGYTDSVSTTVRYAFANGNLYFTGNDGVYKVEALAGAIAESGIPQALDGSGSVATGSFLANNKAVSYRIVWGIKDVNKNLILGAPSQRIYVSNTSGVDKDVSLTFNVPAEITTSHFYQIYRTKQAATASDPGDTCYLVYESSPSSTDISNKYVTVTDSCTDSLVGVELYTNENYEGILQSNYQPPKANDICVYQNHMFFSDLTYRHQISFQLLATGTSTTLQVNDTITVAGQTYTAKAAENIASKEFLCSTSSGSPATDIRLTMESLVKCINKNTSNTTVYAFYTSSYNDLPGKVRVESRAMGGSSFTFTSSKTTAFNPNSLPITSEAETVQNGIAYSKKLQPENVPLVNRFTVGSKDDNVLRLQPLRDCMLIFTERSGVWRLTGNDSTNFVVELMDSTVNLIAPNSLATLNNSVFGLFNQGICRLTENAASIISLDIENDIREAMGVSLTNISRYGVGCGYESERQYMLFIPVEATDTIASIGYVYNYVTDAWTTIDRETTDVVVNPTTDRLLLATKNNWLSVERKAFNFTDMVDEEIDVTVTDVDGVVLTLSNATGVEEGDVYWESDTLFSPITAVDLIANTITLAETGNTYSTGSHHVLQTYETSLEFNPLNFENVSHIKQLSEIELVFDPAPQDFSLEIKSDASDSWESVEFTNISSLGVWGFGEYGDGVWGGEEENTRRVRTYIPRTKQRCGSITVRVSTASAYNQWNLLGFEITGRSSSARGSKA